MKIEIKDLSELDVAAQMFINLMRENAVFAFYGEMGAGKTTFIKAVCKRLGVEETITSPTFAIVNEYGRENENPIYHFDFYRVNKIEEAIDFGCTDYFHSGNICFIEWPQIIEQILPEQTQKINIRETENKTRVIEFI